MRVTRTLHHSMNVEGELDRSIEFYRQFFDMPDEDRPIIPGVEGHWFTAGNAQIHLVDAPAEAFKPPIAAMMSAAKDLRERGILISIQR